MNTNYALRYIFQLILILTFACSGFAQDKKTDLVPSYKEYTELPREISYAHLNKTSYLKGEIMAYTIYVFDKMKKKPLTTNTNVYCTISDENDKIVKSEMILAANGIADGSFQIDDFFTSGKYTFRAYTNWMRNFDEPNLYTQEIQIIDSEVDASQKTMVTSSKLDAQFLPEGGHLIADVKNSVGVIIKDSLGFGVPDVSGKIIDSKNNVLVDFKTNSLGIGKFTFLPNEVDLYHAILDLNGTEQKFSIKKAEKQGIALTMNDLNSRVALSFRTNKSTIDQIGDTNYTLAIHNGNTLRTVNVSFEKSLEDVKMVNYEDLNPGINIFTLFDENGQALMERLFFKYDGITLLTSENPIIANSKDSLSIKVPINNINKNLLNNFSVSVLPAGTKSYNPNNNIISETYLQPYIKSYIEDASYYFTDITRKKKFELDNVLLTQGWSSYNWNTVFNNPPEELYEYENGISFRANVNNKTASEYLMYASINNQMEIFDFEKGNKAFGAIGLYPMEAERIRFSAIKKNNHLEKPNLYLQFSPAAIPNIIDNNTVAPLKDNITYLNTNPMFQSSWEKRELLKDVLITTNKEVKRADKVKMTAFGKIDVFDDLKRKTSFDFANYLRSKGYLVFEGMGSLKIMTRRAVSISDPTAKFPVVYLDNVRLADTDILYKFNMDYVDYIYINKFGAGEGGDSNGGVIKIFTDPNLSSNQSKFDVVQEVSVPLTFSTPQKFYTPEYTSYQSKFYQDYGVIDWFPRLIIEEDGNINFKIRTPQINHLSIFIEGTANDGSFISERKEINLK